MSIQWNEEHFEFVLYDAKFNYFPFNEQNIMDHNLQFLQKKPLQLSQWEFELTMKNAIIIMNDNDKFLTLIFDLGVFKDNINYLNYS